MGSRLILLRRKRKLTFDFHSFEKAYEHLQGCLRSFIKGEGRRDGDCVHPPMKFCRCGKNLLTNELSVAYFAVILEVTDPKDLKKLDELMKPLEPLYKEEELRVYNVLKVKLDDEYLLPSVFIAVSRDFINWSDDFERVLKKLGMSYRRLSVVMKNKNFGIVKMNATYHYLSLYKEIVTFLGKEINEILSSCMCLKDDNVVFDVYCLINERIRLGEYEEVPIHLLPLYLNEMISDLMKLNVSSILKLPRLTTKMQNVYKGMSLLRQMIDFRTDLLAILQDVEEDLEYVEQSMGKLDEVSRRAVEALLDDVKERYKLMKWIYTYTGGVIDKMDNLIERIMNLQLFNINIYFFVLTILSILIMVTQLLMAFVVH
ncbi:hypothetical protein IPA_02085 [Ignicoccus pacificus DSM 13166]|uniref:Uncharacterized protein n=1 Tax=Ignicoccus pacificus DSM 13166 TaxID=940294 RepID=A0A977PKM7_9CREN|nr:hypothetical protein IPA_02085 [Ignicoccus pacificus DSM 13166]